MMPRGGDEHLLLGSPGQDATAPRLEVGAGQGEQAQRGAQVSGEVVVDVHHEAGEASVAGDVPSKTMRAPRHLDLVGEETSCLPRRSLLAATLVLGTLASVIVSAAVAAAVAASLSAPEGVGSVLAPSARFVAIDGSFGERRLDSAGASGMGDSSANATDLEHVAAAGELVDGHSADGVESLCSDAATGEVCHRLVVWAMEDGLRLYPESFTGLTRASPFQAFQQVMHQRNPELCPSPCLSDVVPIGSLERPAALAPMVSTYGSHGSCNYGHIDSAPAHSGCFVVHNGRLLTEKLTYDGMPYDIPGGQSDWHEPARCTAHREALEETGYNVAPKELLAVVRNNFHIYRCVLLQSNPIKGHDHEISWVGWMSPGEVREKVRQHSFRFPEAARYVDWMR